MLSCSCHRGQANLVVCSVKDTVVLADENISKDPELTRLSWDADGLKATCAIALLALKQEIQWEVDSVSQASTEYLDADKVLGSQTQGNLTLSEICELYAKDIMFSNTH